jgi:hypothetical protein
MGRPTDFDFWLGTWEARWGHAPDDHGTNVIRRTHGGKVVDGRFDGQPGADFQGSSVSVFDEHRDVWLQTWDDDAGDYFALEGMFAGGEMVLLCDRHTAPDPDVHHRMRFFDITPESFSWTWERGRKDEGTHELAWRIDYRRLAGPD